VVVARVSVGPCDATVENKMSPIGSGLSQVFNKCSVSSRQLYSCCWLRTWRAYADVGVLVGINITRSLYRTAMSLSDCPTYERLQVLHRSL
jgi:hypothetical protein